MKVRFLESTRRDLFWFRRYYTTNFPGGDEAAKRAYNAAKRLVSDHPFAGKVVDASNLREIQVARTPFAFIYRVTENEIQILRVWDGRRDRPENWDKP